MSTNGSIFFYSTCLFIVACAMDLNDHALQYYALVNWIFSIIVISKADLHFQYVEKITENKTFYVEAKIYKTRTSLQILSD